MLKQNAYAKLDLAIHIETKKTADGYYPVHYVDCQIDVYDKLTFKSQADKIEVKCSDPTLPTDEDNFVMRAARLLKEMVGNDHLGAEITLVKNIPIKAGFGGGSSDAAATISGLSRLWKIKLSDNQIRSFSRELGKDFFYSYHGKLSEVLGEGKNYKIAPIKSALPDFWLVVVVPIDEKPSTGWVYEHLGERNIGKNFDRIERLKMALSKHDRIGILQNLTNDFEEFMTSKFPVIGGIKNDLVNAGAEATIMAGAGLSMVGFFASKKEAQDAKAKLQGRHGIRQILVARNL